VRRAGRVSSNLPTYLLTCLPAYLLACRHTRYTTVICLDLPTNLPTNLRTNLRTNLPTHQPLYIGRRFRTTVRTVRIDVQVG
jgi:hypothetical protein